MTAERWNLRRNHGYTLPLAMVILLIAGNIGLAIFAMIKSERIESFHRYEKSQAELDIESALDYALAKIQSSKEPWRTDSLAYQSTDGNIRFSLLHKQSGAYALLDIFSKDSLLQSSVYSGFVQPNLPAVTVLSRNITLALAQGSKIKGGVAIRSGQVNYSSHYKMMADKSTSYDTTYSEKDFTLFDSLQYFPQNTRNQFDSVFTKNLCEFDAKDKLPNELACRKVVVQGDAQCDRCSIKAESIKIIGNSIFKKASIKARTAELGENATISGVVFVQDTLSVNLRKEQELPLKLILQGRKTGAVEYTGTMDIEKLRAKKALLMFVGDNWDETMPKIPVRISDKCNIVGTLVSKGTVDFQGTLKGSAIVWDFGFDEGGTRWRNFLRKASFERDSTAITFLPDIFHMGGEASYEKL
ncbi:hypothetical protein [Fibrobacter succinogenes]|uniref:hypothetical protein n=1 Tax=Fibrobacter succinogenes TaxID=833 RepID=UPI001565F72A|nr:hypothetical protein [Fibrobacter succinogenes]